MKEWFEEVERVERECVSEEEEYNDLIRLQLYIYIRWIYIYILFIGIKYAV